MPPCAVSGKDAQAGPAARKEQIMAVPKAMQGKYDEMASILTDYADKYLNEGYKELLLKALEKLCRKRPSPLLKGKARTWAAGIVYAVGQTNFIFDKAQKIHMSASELVEPLGVSPSTASGKAREIRKWLKMSPFDFHWCIPEIMETSPISWMVIVNGLPIDARRLPLALQIECYEKGLIPYVPALEEAEKQPKDAE